MVCWHVVMRCVAWWQIGWRVAAFAVLNGFGVMICVPTYPTKDYIDHKRVRERKHLRIKRKKTHSVKNEENEKRG